MISTRLQEGVAVVTLDRGVTNAINLNLVRALSDTITGIAEDDAARSLVLASANQKFFSIGFDLPELLALSRVEFAAFYRVFNRLSLQLYTVAKPTVAALTGHAVAGGCILALACDYRLSAGGRKLMGLNEVKLGVPVPYPADCMVRSLVGVGAARAVLEQGELTAAEQSLQLGLIDRILPLEEVLPAAVALAAELGSAPLPAFAMIKRNRVEPVQRQVEALLQARQQYFLDCWYAPETRQRLQQAAEKF